jgi:hypothetical protein
MPPFRKDDTMSVKEIWKELERKVSIRKIYYLIEHGELAPAFRFAGKRGTCVVKEAVIAYKERCVIDVGV